MKLKQASKNIDDLWNEATIHGLKNYLASGIIKNIDPIYALEIINHFGYDTIDIIDNNPEKLAEVQGIDPKQIEKRANALSYRP